MKKAIFFQEVEEKTDAPVFGLRLYNDFLLARVVYALYELGFFKFVEEKPLFQLADLEKALNIKNDRIKVYTGFLEDMKILERRDDHYAVTPEVQESLKRELGYLIWLIGGYDSVLSSANKILAGSAQYGKDILRDDYEMARGSAAILKSNTDHHLYALFENELAHIRVMADIGCGSALKLIDLCRRFPRLNGIGVDLSEECCQLARSNVEQAGLSDRIDIVHARGEKWLRDQRANRNRDNHTPVDLIMNVGMFHDLLNLGVAKEFLADVRGAIGPEGRLLIQDQMRFSSPNQDQSSWVRGFELIHHLMGQVLYTREEYEHCFSEAGLIPERSILTDIPEHYIFLLGA